jgi:hypothetical protein
MLPMSGAMALRSRRTNNKTEEQKIEAKLLSTLPKS